MGINYPKLFSMEDSYITSVVQFESSQLADLRDKIQRCKDHISSLPGS